MTSITTAEGASKLIPFFPHIGRRRAMVNNIVRGQCHFCKATPPVLEMLFHEGYFLCEQRCIDGICDFATENTNLKEEGDGET